MKDGSPQGKIDILCYTPWNLIYAEADNDKTVLKGHQIWLDGKSYDNRLLSFPGSLEREAAVYEKLGDHPRITKCYGLEEVGPGTKALRLERSHVGSVRNYILDHFDEPPSMNTRIQMATDFAEGMKHLHEKDVTWYDASTRNALFFDDFRIKLCDFGTAVIQGTNLEQVQGYEVRYLLPLRGRTFEELPLVQRELFALGSAIYELTEWKMPFYGMDEEDVNMKLHNDEQSFITPMNPVASIINNCWQEKYGSAEEVVCDLLADSGACEG